jgi:SAM-dependent methyltransferase/uncharacterized protein YbaR (Trm112 family)|tara:strand:+ start:651 stop:1850 length:1200 start_codon:yes stop_codon:yes gene_type:complete
MCEGRLECETISEESRILSREDSKKCSAWNIDASSLETIVKEGILFCNECQTWYPITNYVPIMLDFPIHLHKTFYETNKKRINSLGPFKIPGNSPRPGEEYIQRSFTRQWDDLGFDDMKFGYSNEQLKNYHRVELDWPDWVLKTSGKKLLDIGCGFGQEALILQEITNDEVFAIDLNLSLIKSSQHMAAEPFIHTMVASLFNLPFSKSYFDIVFSNGVLLHTYSTRAGFESILRYMNDDGMIYIWLSVWERKFRRKKSWMKTIKLMVRDFMEIYARPIVARVPLVLQDIIVYTLAIKRHWKLRKRLRKKKKNIGKVSIQENTPKFRNAVHEIRDFWTPLYVHHEAIIEVIEWFQEKGLEYRLIDTLKFKQLVGSPMRNLGIRGIKKTNSRSLLKERDSV